MQVRRELEDLTGRSVAIGAVYATLDRLEAKGYVTSKRAQIGGKSKRLFEVQVTGVEALEYTQSMRRRLWQGVDLGTARA